MSSVGAPWENRVVFGLSSKKTLPAPDSGVGADAFAREARAPTGGALATVLLSPAAASFDMFVDYAARGRAFKDIVTTLAERQGGGDR